MEPKGISGQPVENTQDIPIHLNTHNVVQSKIINDDYSNVHFYSPSFIVQYSTSLKKRNGNIKQ